MTTERELSWVFLLPALLVPTLGSLIYFVWFPEGKLGQAAYSATKIFTLLYPVLFLKWVGLGGLIRRMRTHAEVRWPRWRTIVLTGFGSGLAIAVGGIPSHAHSAGNDGAGGGWRGRRQGGGAGF